VSAGTFPLFLKLGGRRVLLVGAGRVAWWKLETLLAAGADVTVVAPAALPEFSRAPARLVLRPFEEDDLDGVWLVVSAATPDVNRRVAAAASARRVFVNSVDDPDHATAYAGSVLRRDGVTVAVSTDGRAPALARLLREALDSLLPADVSSWTDVARGLRRAWREARVPLEARRPLLLHALNRLYPRERLTS